MADYASASMPQPDPAFFEQALANAARARNTRHHNRGWLKGFGSAVAAGLMIWFVAGDWMGSRAVPDASIPQVTMALEDPRIINLVFSSATDLNDATLTVSLPPGIELHGFHGQREISWVTSLREGRNLLPLKLIALSPQGGELMATLRHDDDNKTFKLQVTVSNGASLLPARQMENWT